MVQEDLRHGLSDQLSPFMRLIMRNNRKPITKKDGVPSTVPAFPQVEPPVVAAVETGV